MDEFRRDDPFPPTPEGFHLRVMKTLDGLKEEPMKRRHKIGTAALVAAIILVLAFGAALAAGYFSGEIDWTGRRVAEDEAPSPEPTETPAETADADAQYSEQDIFADQLEDEYWIIENEDGSGTALDCKKTFNSLETLNEFLKAGATDFRLVAKAPEGYAFRGAYCTFYFTKEIVEGATVTREDIGDGMTLVRVKPGDGYLPLVASYWVDFRNEAGERVSAYANLSEVNLKDSSFGVYEGDVYESLKIDGMIYALFFDKGEFRKVYMIEKTSRAKGYTHLFGMPSILDGSDDGVTFKYIRYEIGSTSLAKDELIELAESLK
jgi:hypothetical protein